MAARHPWGSIRKLRSGRYQARYRHEGIAHTGPTTFRTKSEANAWLAGVRVDLERGSWVDPDAGCIRLADYATRWLAERPGLRPRTRELYESELRLHILPALGDLQLRQLSSARVRSWHAEMSQRQKPGPTTVAKCYRLLRAILSTAVEDELILKNPCVLKRAGVEKAPERPVATIEQVYALADAIEPRFRALVLLATFTGLRLGELRALRRNKLDLLRTKVHVVEQMQELADGTLLVGEPKSDAGRRTVFFPQAIVADMEAHLASWAAPGRDGLVFCGTNGQPLRRATFLHGVGPSDAPGRCRPQPAFPRPSPHGQHVGRGDRRQHQGADGAPRPFISEGGPDLSTRHGGSRCGYRSCAQRSDSPPRTAAVVRECGGSLTLGFGEAR